MASFSQSEADVRSALIQTLVETLGFPRSLLVVEKEIHQLPHVTVFRPPKRRIDLLAYGVVKKEWIPLLLVECKKQALEDAAAQVIGYNAFVCAPFVALVSRTEVQWGYCEKTSGTYVWHPGLPSYTALLRALGEGV